MLGIAWVILYPIVFLGMYSLIYIFVFKVRFGLFNTNEYVAVIFCGLIPFLGFCEGLSMGIPSVVTNASLIKNTLFPIELIPVKAVLIGQFTQVVGMALLLLVAGLLGKVTIYWGLLPVIWCFQMIMTVGIVWFFSALNVFLRDIQTMIGPVILMLMMVSPIAYTADMVPPELRHFLAINPLYYIIISYQDSLMLGQFPRGSILLWLGLLSLFCFGGGYWFFSRLKGVFSTNV